MPIYIDSTPFIDVFGNATTFYVSDAGDKVEMQFNLRSSIRMSSVANPLTLDPILDQVTSAAVGWLDEGFRVGDTVLCRVYSSGGSIINEFWSTLVYVDNVLADFSAMPNWYDITAGEIMVFFAVTGPGSYTVIARDDLDVLFGHQKNSSPGSEFSLIDGEVSRLQFQNVASLSVGGVVNGLIVGNQSGEFIISGELERTPNTESGFYNHTVTITFVNSGIYNDGGTWFFSSECLKIYSKLLWARLAGEPFARAESIYNLEANTGFFDEPHNSSVLNSSLTLGFNELDYCVATDFQIVVEGPLTDVGIGAAYRSINTNYYKNQIESQNSLAMTIPTTPIALGVINSNLNPTGAGYDIEITSIVQGIGVTTIEGTFTPNAAFNVFFDNVDDLDRLFYLWVKCGNSNLLAFEGQLFCEPPVGGPLLMVQDYGYLDHCENIDVVDSTEGDLTGFIADTEDDIAYFGRFLLDKNQVYESFNVKMEAFNTSTLEDFTLAIVTFSFAGVQISNDGVYLLNETQGINLTLPTTSEKREVNLTLDPTIDTPTQFGVQIYAPWLLNWRYWLTQLNANVDFFPTQNQNWEQYDNLGDWELRTELTLIKEGLAYTHANTIIDREYNAEKLINSNIDLIIDSSNTIVNVVPIGNLMRIKSTHEVGGAWDQLATWGMLTIESYESAPRWICSSCLPSDNNTSNPLSPLSGATITIIFPSPEIAILECYFDPSLIDLSNGIKITAKIKDNNEFVLRKTTAPIDDPKTTADADADKTLAP